mgnify:CR=1 FL=1
MSDRILIVDFGSQFTQLIARRVREARVYCEIHPPTRSVAWIREWNPTGIMVGVMAVVTGASKGIGAGIAKALGAAVASVVVNYASDKTGAEKAVAASKSLSEVFAKLEPQMEKLSDAELQAAPGSGAKAG